MADNEATSGPGKKPKGRTAKQSSIFGRVFQKGKDEPVSSNQGQAPSKKGEGVAHVPTAVLTVEYVDEGPAMDAALRDLEKKLVHVENLMNSLQETTRNLVAGFNKQNRDVMQMIESITRRLDNLYQRAGTAPAGVSGERAAASSGASEAAVADVDAEEMPPVPEQYLEDAEHKRAQRIARVMASDLEAYNESKVREGILYGNFHELMAKQIEDAQKTFDQRVPERVRQEYDHFSAAISELVQRKRQELLSGDGKEGG